LTSNTTNELAAGGYWPARGAAALAEGRYSRAVEICRTHLPSEPDLISGRLVYGRALFHAGQLDSAETEFYRVLSQDPDNQVALKYLGDLLFGNGDEFGALAHYQRILEIDPGCQGLHCEMKSQAAEKTHTVTLSRSPEKKPAAQAKPPLREISFYTETMGDLYLSQGCPRLAREVFRTLIDGNENPRLVEKMALASESIKEKEA
jgi:tetratricopeptide (TPR) repeat protein